MRREHRSGRVIVVFLLATIAVGGAVLAPALGAVSPAADDASTTERSAIAGNATEATSTENATHIVYFYSPGCPHCANVDAYLDRQRDDHTFRVETYVARTHTERFTEYLRTYDVPRQQWYTVPAVFIGDEYAIGDQPAIELIGARLNGSGTGTTPSPTAGAPGSSGTESGPENVTLIGLAVLAVTDAINPCALAVLVVLLTTILTRNPEDYGQVLRAGLAFSLAVGLTYSVMGVLLVFGFKSVANVGAVDLPILRQLVGLLAIGLGLLNLKDAIGDIVVRVSDSVLTPVHEVVGPRVPEWPWARQRVFDGWSAIRRTAGQCSAEVPDRWRPAMQRHLTEPLWAHESAIAGAALAGVGVSLFLLPCTAGPYAVAGGLLADMPWTTALPLLGFYNLIFVAPMIAITVAVGGGFASADAVGAWRERHIERLHLVAGLLLVAVGVLLAAGLL